MLISLHKQATATPKIRAGIQVSKEPVWIVAERYQPLVMPAGPVIVDEADFMLQAKCGEMAERALCQ